MKFKLETPERTYTDDEISRSLLREQLDKSAKQEIDFLILTPSEPIAGSIFMQTTAGTILEIAFKSDDVEQYRYITNDPNEIAEMFLTYYQREKLPDIGKFKDISKEVKHPSVVVRLFDRLARFLTGSR